MTADSPEQAEREAAVTHERIRLREAVWPLGGTDKTKALDAMSALETTARAAGRAELEGALLEYREAMRLTREYVGEELLPALPGWSWFDADERARALPSEGAE